MKETNGRPPRSATAPFIFTTSDANYLPGALVTLYSALQHANTTDFVLVTSAPTSPLLDPGVFRFNTDDPLAYFLTWTTYGTWLPGDERGWIRKGKGFQLPQLVIQANAGDRMTELACTLDAPQRRIVEETIAEHCEVRQWKLHAVN